MFEISGTRDRDGWMTGLENDLSLAIETVDELNGEWFKNRHQIASDCKPLLNFLFCGSLEHLLNDTEESPFQQSRKSS